MTKMAGSGSISQRHGSADLDPDPPQNVLDPQHCTVGIPILLGGISDPFLVRSLFELEGWLRGSSDPYPRETWGILLDKMRELGTGGTRVGSRTRQGSPTPSAISDNQIGHGSVKTGLTFQMVSRPSSRSMSLRSSVP